jgi:hypothetical protein
MGSGAMALLQDVSGLLSSSAVKTQSAEQTPHTPQQKPRNFSRPGGSYRSSTSSRSATRDSSPFSSSPGPSRHGGRNHEDPVLDSNVMELQDAGGLLSRDIADTRKS